MKLTTKQKWLRTIAWLRRNFPAQKPVYIRSKSIKKDTGYTTLEGYWFLIVIHRKQSFELRLDTLLHEWAHCLTWFGAEQNEDHSGEFGLCWAKIYRTFLEWDFGRKKKE